MNIKLQNIKKTFGKLVALNISTFEFESGKSYAILGPNGSGKSTLLKIIAGIEECSEGIISYSNYQDQSNMDLSSLDLSNMNLSNVDNSNSDLSSVNLSNMDNSNWDLSSVDLSNLNLSSLDRSTLDLSPTDFSYMPQKPYIFNTTVLKNIQHGINSSKQSSKNCSKISQLAIENSLKSLDLFKYINTNATNLSGGEAQKLAIIRTLIDAKNIVLLDEPTSAIDIYSISKVENFILDTIKNRNSTLIFATHNPYQALRIADNVIILFNGNVIESGHSDKVLKNPSTTQTKEFLKNWS